MTLTRSLRSIRSRSNGDPPALPPGQHAVPPRRFGLVQGARWRPDETPPLSLRIGGQVHHPVTVTWDELAAEVPYRRQRSDLHCVATWSSVDLEWGGLPFAEVLDVLVRRAQPVSACRWLTLTAHDGTRCGLSIEDAREDRVLLADELNGEPLPFDHGAPLRLVAPAQYGYKNLKHLQRIDFYPLFRPGSAGRAEHPRARVDLEERSPGLPGWVFRPFYRALTPAVLRAFRKAEQARDPRR